MTVNDILDQQMMAAVLDGQESGIELAIEILTASKARVAPENQTWDSAIAFLQLFLARAKKERA